jgi:hypothetical protein
LKAREKTHKYSGRKIFQVLSDSIKLLPVNKFKIVLKEFLYATVSIAWMTSLRVNRQLCQLVSITP